jgi:MoxR-like ATPase
MNIKSRITGLLEYISQGIYEKNEAIALTLLAFIARESIFLLGPPGMMIRIMAIAVYHSMIDTFFPGSIGNAKSIIFWRWLNVK